MLSTIAATKSGSSGREAATRSVALSRTTTAKRLVVHRLSVAVDSVGADEHRCPALLGHHSVILVPVVVFTAGCDEDRSKQQPQPFGVQPGLGVIRSGELGSPFDRRSLPTVAEGGGDLG